MLKRLNRYSRVQTHDHGRPGDVAVSLDSGAFTGSSRLLPAGAPGGRPLGSSRSIPLVAELAGWTEVVIPGGQEHFSGLNTADKAVLVNTSLGLTGSGPWVLELSGESCCSGYGEAFSCPSNHEVMI